MSVDVSDYDPLRKQEWDKFIATAKNGVFLFERDYMEYHAERFRDASLIFADESGEIIGLMPASLDGDILSSHGGLTFGGILSGTGMKVGLMLEVFDAMLSHLRARGVRRLVYKAIPHIYHRFPAEEDLYALFRHQAKLIRRDVSSTIDLKEKLTFSKGRKYEIKQAQKHGLQVKQSTDYQSFMAIEEHVLSTKYDSKPVHTAAELQLLASRFPDNIKLFVAARDDVAVGGVVVYESQNVAHAQYIASNDEGKKSGALDLVLSYLISDYYSTKKYFDFGISTENDGQDLNVGLIANKQSFGARAVVYDFYQLDLTD